MIRPIKYSLFIVALALVVGASFAGGRQLRRVAVGPLHRNARVSSLAGAGLGGVEMVAAAENGDDSTPNETFQTVYQYIKSEYVDRVDNDSKLANGAVRNMLASLDDPYTRYLEPAQLQALESQLNGTYIGIGATVAVVKQKKDDVDYRRLAVIAPAPGGPADQAGVRPGDVITYIDGKWIIAYSPRVDLDRIRNEDKPEAQKRNEVKDLTKRFTEGITLPKALELINAKDAKTLELTLERPGSTTPVKVKVTTATTTVDPVQFRALDDRTAYLRVTEFNDRAAQELNTALSQAAGKRLIVDLRDNSGGPVRGAGSLPPAAVSLLGRLTHGGQIGSVVRKGNVREPITLPSGPGWNGKLVVLINGGTANVAEVVASALKEKAGARLIGEHTFGDSVLQRLVALRDGAAMTLNAGKLLASNGQELTGKGLTPDIAVAAGSPVVENDAAVQRAVSALAGA